MSKVVYRRFVPTFWNDPDVKRVLTLDQKAFLVYLFTNEHGHPCGVYRLPLLYVMDETGKTPEESMALFSGPLEAFCTYDPRTEEIFVHAMAKHQIDEDGLHGKDKRIPWVEKQLASVRAKHLVAAFSERYADWGLNWETFRPKPGGNGGPTPQTKGHSKGLGETLDKGLPEPLGQEPEAAGVPKERNGLVEPKQKGLMEGLGKPAAATAAETTGLEQNLPAVPELPEDPVPLDSGFVHPGKRLSASQVLRAWESRQPRPLAEIDRERQKHAARKIADHHSAEDVMLAFVGMCGLWPHCPPKNEPWDLFDLDKKFPKAVRSAGNHPELRSRAREAELLSELGAVG